MLLATYAVVVSISLLTTVAVSNLAMAQSSTLDRSWLESTNDVSTQAGTNATKTEAPQSLEIEGLSPQGADDLAIACIYFPERC